MGTNNLHITFNKITVLLLFVVGLVFSIKILSSPIADFGNYYYGSKLYLNGLFTKEMYADLNYFNSHIVKYGEHNYFENYIPVPPISVLFYAPFCWLSSGMAKCVFNLMSLLVFCYSIHKLLQFKQIVSPLILVLPFAILLPLYSNIYQGQAYLLIVAFLILAFIYAEQNRVHIPALLLSLCIVLKLFPVFVLLYFVLTKKYKIVLWTLVYVLLLWMSSAWLIGYDLVKYYTLEIVPRLLNNDVVGTFHATNQSLYSLLQNVFMVNYQEGTMPMVHIPWMVPLIESISVGLVLYYLYSKRKADAFQLFGWTLFALILINRYNTTYALVLLIPMLIGLIQQLKWNWKYLLCITLLLLGLFIPSGYFINNASVMVRFSKVLVFLTAFLIIFTMFKDRINYLLLLAVVIMVFLVKYATFKVEEFSTFQVQCKKGILYHLDLHLDTLILTSTVGEKSVVEHYYIGGNAHFDNDLKVTDNKIVYQGNVISAGSGNKAKAFLYNDTSIVYMSDASQGVRFYKLHEVSINEH